MNGHAPSHKKIHRCWALQSSVVGSLTSKVPHISGARHTPAPGTQLPLDPSFTMTLRTCLGKVNIVARRK